MLALFMAMLINCGFCTDYMRRVGGASGVHHICVRRAGWYGRDVTCAVMQHYPPHGLMILPSVRCQRFPSLRGVFARSVAPDAAHNDTSDDVSNSAGGNHNQSSRHGRIQ